MYFLVLFPLLFAAWVLLSKFCFERRVDSRPLLYFGVVFAVSLVVTEVVLGHPFSWLRFRSVSDAKLELATTWQHGLSALVPAVYLFVKRSRAPRDIAIAIGLWMVCNAAFVTSVVIDARIDYRFELEWLEGTMVDQTLVAKQGGIYAAASPEFTPLLYGPAFFRTLSVMPYIEQSPFIWGRLLSLFMAGLIVMLIYACSTLLAKDAWLGLLVGVAFFASHRFVGYWFDLYRVDTMAFFLLLFGGVLLWQRPKSRAAIVLAGFVLALSVFTKQSTGMMVLFFVLWFLLAHGWRSALWLMGAGAASGVLLLVLELILSGSRFIDYYVEMVFAYPLQWERVRNRFLERDFMALPGLLTMFLAASGLVAHFRRLGAREFARSVFPYVIVIFTLTSMFMRSKEGGWANCRIPMVMAGLLGVALWFGEHRERPGPGGIYPALILMLAYMWFMDPLGADNRQQVPTKRDLKAQKRLVKYLRKRPGKVWVSFHTHLCYQAKKQMCHNTAPVGDWYKLHESVPDSFLEEMQSGELSTIVLDTTPRWYQGPLRTELNKRYRCKGNRFKWAKEQGKTVTGWQNRPERFCELKKSADP